MKNALSESNRDEAKGNEKEILRYSTFLVGYSIFLYVL